MHEVTREREPGLLTATEVAKELRLSYQGALSLLRRGIVPATRVGKAYRVRRADLDAVTTPVDRGRGHGV